MRHSLYCNVTHSLYCNCTASPLLYCPVCAITGCTDLLALDLRGLAAVAALQSDPESGASLTKPPAPVLMWHALASTPPRDPLSSEGISLLVLQHPLPAATAATAGSHSAPAATAGHGSSANGSSASAASGATAGKGGVLLAFGGYNGKYTNAVSVLRVPPSLAAAPEAPVVHKTPAASAQAKPAAAQDGKKNSAGGAAAAAAAGKEKEKEAMAAAGDAKDRQIAELKAALEAARNVSGGADGTSLWIDAKKLVSVGRDTGTDEPLVLVILAMLVQCFKMVHRFVRPFITLATACLPRACPPAPGAFLYTCTQRADCTLACRTDPAHCVHLYPQAHEHQT